MEGMNGHAVKEDSARLRATAGSERLSDAAGMAAALPRDDEHHSNADDTTASRQKRAKAARRRRPWPDAGAVAHRARWSG
jgi:hypothetical protein